MLVAFALLGNDHLHNVIRKLALTVHRTHGTGLHAGILPPHISLKQPFRITDLPAIEAFLGLYLQPAPAIAVFSGWRWRRTSTFVPSTTGSMQTWRTNSHRQKRRLTARPITFMRRWRSYSSRPATARSYKTTVGSG